MKSWPWYFQSGKIWAIVCLSAGFLLTSIAPLGAAEQVVDSPVISTDAIEPYLSPTNGLGSWIWTTNTFDGQMCQFWRTFEIPANAKIAAARLVMTADNEFILYLDGRKLGHGAEWHELFIFDLSQILFPGHHVLAVEAINGASFAGMLFGLRVDLVDGRLIEVKSDQSWKIVPEGVKRWEKRTEAQPDWHEATIVAPLGGSPWWTQPLNVDRMPSLLPIKVYFWQTGWFQITLLSLCSFVILISLRLMAQLALHQKEHWLLQQERARIARDIHDDIGSRMTQLVLHGEVAQSDLAEDSKMRMQLDRICEEARGLLSSMDEILWAVNPRRDTLRDFAAYVCGYAQQFLKATPIQCLFEVDPEMVAATFDLPQRRSLLMAIKETLNNAVKHSQATELHLKIQWQRQRLIVIVQDNGRGMDLTTMKPGRSGLANITQRMQEMGGSCQVTSQPGNGCRIEFGVPIKPPRRFLRNWLWKPNLFSGPTRNPQHLPSNDPSQSHDPTQC